MHTHINMCVYHRLHMPSPKGCALPTPCNIWRVFRNLSQATELLEPHMPVSKARRRLQALGSRGRWLVATLVALSCSSVKSASGVLKPSVIVLKACAGLNCLQGHHGTATFHCATCSIHVFLQIQVFVLRAWFRCQTRPAFTKRV